MYWEDLVFNATASYWKCSEASLSLEHNTVPIPSRKLNTIINNTQPCTFQGVNILTCADDVHNPANVPAIGHMQTENTALVNDNEMWRVAATMFTTLSDDVTFRKKKTTTTNVILKARSVINGMK